MKNEKTLSIVILLLLFCLYHVPSLRISLFLNFIENFLRVLFSIERLFKTEPLFVIFFFFFICPCMIFFILRMGHGATENDASIKRSCVHKLSLRKFGIETKRWVDWS